jgi:hypothetical protein
MVFGTAADPHPPREPTSSRATSGQGEGGEAPLYTSPGVNSNYTASLGAGKLMLPSGWETATAKC